MKNTPRSRQSNLVVQELKKEVLIYDLTLNKVYCLNETSALVYQLCNGKRTVGEIADLMSVKLKTLVSEDFVWLAIYELKRDGLIDNPDEIEKYFSVISRRELATKAALATIIALPLVTSLTAPQAAQAASGVTANFCKDFPCIDGQGPPATVPSGCNPPDGCGQLGGGGLVCCAFVQGGPSCICASASQCTQLGGQVCPGPVR